MTRQPDVTDSWGLRYPRSRSACEPRRCVENPKRAARSDAHWPAVTAIALLATLMAAAVPGVGQTPPRLAPGALLVDYKLVLALHPLMANYDLLLGRHLRTGVAFHDQAVMGPINERINRANEAARPRIEALERELDRLRRERGDVERRMMGMVGEVNEERGTFNITEVNRAQRAKLTELDRKISGIAQQIEAVRDEVMDPLYLPRAQSADRIRQALQEIDGILANLSTQAGGAMVLDRDFVPAPSARPGLVVTAGTVGADPLSISLFQRLLQGEVSPEVPPAYRNDPELQKYAAQMKAQISGSISQNLAAQISKSPLFAMVPGVAGRLVIVGGAQADVTRQVLGEIYQRHQIKPEVAQRILGMVRTE